MNRWASCQQQKALVGFGCAGELRRGDNSNGVVCPKPRRIVNVNDPVSFRSSRLLHNNNHHMEALESRAGTELLDIILTKGDYGAEKSNYQVDSSPPFYSGSPPVRASNPLVQDEQFQNGKPSPLSPSIELPLHCSPSSRKSLNGGGCVRVTYGRNQPPVRVEGFNCRVSAVA